MLQKCYEQGQGRGERRGLVCMVRELVTRKQASELAKCKLDYENWLNSPKDYKLWVKVWELDKTFTVKEFTTPKEMKDYIKARDNKYILCDERYGEEGANRSHWSTHYGEGF